jgi:hypothetical protein
MRLFGTLRCLLLVLACCAETPGERASSLASNPSQSAPNNRNVKRSLTTQQKRGLRLLKAAEAQASALSPEMRAFVLWKVGVAYERFNQQQAIASFKRAFAVTREIEDRAEQGEEEPCPDEVCHVKRWIQHGLLFRMAKLSPETAEQLLGQAESAIRSSISARLVEEYAKKKETEHAKALLTQLAEQGRYPYYAAGELMSALPADSPDRLFVFSQALNYFEQQKPRHYGVEMDDLGTMVERFWRGLPPSLVLQAIDAVLEKAKDTDTEHGMQIGIETRKGGVLNFSSGYEYRLFQVLPVVRELDKERAERLLRENSEAKNALEQYSHGRQSGDGTNRGLATTTDDRAWEIRSMTFLPRESSGFIAEKQAREAAVRELRRRMSAIEEEAAKDPKQALVDASNMPQTGPDDNESPRVVCLEQLARVLARKSPSLAKSALDEARKNLDGYAPYDRGETLANEAELYLLIEDVDSAKKVLEESAIAAEKLYASDSDERDPNVAFKGTWPSTAVWRHCVRVAARFSPQLAERLISGIQDTDITEFERAVYGSALLGGSNDFAIVRDVRKRDGEYSFMH